MIIGGCRLGECNYITHGNYHAPEHGAFVQKDNGASGAESGPLENRLHVRRRRDPVQRIVDSFTRRVKEIGPLGLSEGLDLEEIKSKIQEVTKLIPYIKIAEREKLARRLENEDEYEGLYTVEEIDQLLNNVTSYHINPDKCRACMICLRRCPVEAIVGGKNRVHVIDQEKCIKCGTCFEACPPRFKAVEQISGRPVPPPIPEEQRI